MKAEDDPEARIRELEQPLADAARASEIGSNAAPSKWAPPPVPAEPYGGPLQSLPTAARRRGRGLWILLALFVIGMIALPIAIFVFGTHQMTVGGRTSLAPAPSISSVPPPPASTTAVPAGESITVSGINEVRTVACAGGSVSVSGITNSVTITGHCTSVSVSGIQNQVTVDTADRIQASGSGNRITYHNGSPEIGNSGLNNVVDKG